MKAQNVKIKHVSIPHVSEKPFKSRILNGEVGSFLVTPGYPINTLLEINKLRDIWSKMCIKENQEKVISLIFF